jgi:hypothetical protein
MKTTKPELEMRRIERLAQRADHTWSIAGDIAWAVAERVKQAGWATRPGMTALCHPYLGPNSVIKLAAKATLRGQLAELNRDVAELAGAGVSGTWPENQLPLLVELDAITTGAGDNPGTEYLVMLCERYEQGLSRVFSAKPEPIPGPLD